MARCRASCSVPFLGQEEIADIPVLDPISAHAELIEGNNVLRKVVADRVIRTKLAVDRFVGGEQTAHLLEKLSLCLYFRLYIRQFTFMAPGLLLGQGY